MRSNGVFSQAVLRRRFVTTDKLRRPSFSEQTRRAPYSKSVVYSVGLVLWPEMESEPSIKGHPAQDQPVETVWADRAMAKDERLQEQEECSREFMMGVTKSSTLSLEPTNVCTPQRSAMHHVCAQKALVWCSGIEAVRRVKWHLEWEETPDLLRWQA